MNKEVFGDRLMKKQILLLCEKHEVYRGLERDLPFSEKKFPLKMMKRLLELSEDEGEIPCCTSNLNLLLEIQQQLWNVGFDTDIIVAGDEPDTSWCNEIGFEFLGYDICGDSFYHSPVFRAVFEVPDSDFFEETRKNYGKYLNANGLFQNIEDAGLFLEYVKSDKSDTFESEENIRPVKIFGKIPVR